MKRRLLIGVLALSVLALAGAGSLYAYDASRSDVIAEGVTVAGIDVGGLSTDDARQRLRSRLARLLRRAVTVRHAGERFVLSASHARLRFDLERMVEAARAESREGTFLARALRELTGGELDADLPLHASHSPSAVSAFVRRVRRELERPVRDARVEPRATGIRVVRSRRGVAVHGTALAREITARLLDQRARDVIRVPTEERKPTVTTAELRRKYPWFITISRSQKRLRLFRHLELAKTHEIAVGQAGYDTPVGLHRIRSKAINPGWHAPNRAWAGELAGKIIPPGDPRNPIEARWMEFFDGAGIHGTDDIASLGTAASHGCIRMSIPDVIELYERVPIGTPLYIG